MRTVKSGLQACRRVPGQVGAAALPWVPSRVDRRVGWQAAALGIWLWLGYRAPWQGCKATVARSASRCNCPVRSIPRRRRGGRKQRPCKQAVACDQCAQINKQHICCYLAALAGGGMQRPSWQSATAAAAPSTFTTCAGECSRPVVGVQQSQLHLMCRAAVAAPSPCSTAGFVSPLLIGGLFGPLPPVSACSGSNDPLDTLPSLHGAPVTAMRYNEAGDTVISSDAKGVIEYWSAVS